MDIDYSQYSNWEQIQAPTGQIYYKVPGTGYVYDPFLSSAKGRPVLWGNPEPALEEQRKAEKKAEDAANPLNQLAQAAVPMGLALGGQYLGKQIAGPTAQEKLIEAIASNVGGDSTAPMARLAPNVFDTPLDTAMNVDVGGTFGGGGGSGTSFGGGETLGEATPGLLSQAPGTTFMGSPTLGSFLPGLGIAAGAYTGLKQLSGIKDLFKGKKMGMQEKLALALPTFGVSLFADKIPGLTHESTRDVAKRHTKSLLDQGQNDSQWQNYVGGMRKQYESAPTDPSKPFAGKYGSWDEYKNAGLEAGDLTGVYGNLKTFGPDWAKLSQGDRQKVTQGIIDAGLYDSKKGEVEITDQARAKQIRDQVLGATPAVAPPPSRDSEIAKQLAGRLNRR